MKISESRRMRGEKKAKARHEHQAKQNSRFEKRFQALVDAIARGDQEAAKGDLAKLDVVLRQAGKTQEDFQKALDEARKQL